MRVLLLANPSSARGRRAQAAAEATSMLRAAGHEVVTVLTRHYQATRAVGAQILLSSPRPDVLVVVGGDGMVHLGVGLIAGTPLPLGVVPVGTGNDVARHLGLPLRDTAAAVRCIINALQPACRPCDIVTLDAIRMSRPAGLAAVPAHETWGMAVLSAGVDAAVNVRANTLRWPHGQARYLRAIPYELRDLAPYGYRITTDSGTWEGPALLLAIANTSFFGGGLPIAPTARADDGLLDVIRLDPVGRGALVGHLGRLARGRHLDHRRVHHELSTGVLIEPLEAIDACGRRRRRPPRPMVDGEPVALLPLRVEAVAGAVRFLRGRDRAWRPA